ncbi:MAG: hypothetical protein CMI24_02025 [Opitutae bacterium]|nr:hypothetical protein [Opitutae bacterium]MEC8421391.1 YraN family protein [Verrucomicrobiota bacterium]|tara:strand:+ start:62 stop:517 length:456 start_codon:yes stop_codon:yes gene_type:complete
MIGSKFFLPLKKITRRFFWELGLNGIATDNTQKGEYGEWLARRHLRKKGYLLIAENWRSKRNHRLEIDLIFRDQEMLVFVEVRARSSKSFVTGYDSINQKKRINLSHAFKAYLREESNIPNNYRFDVVEIDLANSKRDSNKIFHHENIAIF